MYSKYWFKSKYSLALYLDISFPKLKQCSKEKESVYGGFRTVVANSIST